MRRLTGLTGTLFLLGCGASAGDEAAKRYEMLRVNKGGLAEMCAEAKTVSAAYLADQNEEKFAAWKAKERQQCGAVQEAQIKASRAQASKEQKRIKLQEDKWKTEQEERNRADEANMMSMDF